MGITPGERIVSLDLDALIVNDVTPLFDRPDECVFYHVPGTRVKTVLNGSLFLFTAGRLDWLWTEFDPLTSPRDACKKGYLGSDQAYLSAQLLGKLLPRHPHTQGFACKGAHRVLERAYKTVAPGS
jgi:hypothetical protein